MVEVLDLDEFACAVDAELEQLTLFPVTADGTVVCSARPGDGRYGRYGREMSRAADERYAAGLPLVRKDRKLNRLWTFNCPVPTCLEMYDGYETARACRDGWYAHASGHAGFTPAWPDDVAIEPEPAPASAAKPAKRPAKKRAPQWFIAIHDTDQAGTELTDLVAGYKAMGLTEHVDGTLLLSCPTRPLAEGLAGMLVSSFGARADQVEVLDATDRCALLQPPAPAPADDDRRTKDQLVRSILSTWQPGDRRDHLVWAAGAAVAGHAVSLAAGHLIADRIGPDLYGGTLDCGRVFTATRKKFEVCCAGAVVATVKWTEAARLLPPGALTGELEAAVREACASRNEHLRRFGFGSGDGTVPAEEVRERWAAIEDRCGEVAARVWLAVRPAGVHASG